MITEEGWVELCATNTDYEAHLIIGLLESNGVPARLKSYRISQFPFDIGHMGEIRIMVLHDDLDAAKKIIEDYDKDIKNDNKIQQL